jgi:hypothetical protein
MLLKLDFLGNLDRRIGTRMLLPFLALVGRLVRFLKIIRLAFLMGADAFNTSEVSACPSASCPSCSCCTGPATEVDTYAAHEPLAHPL